jgi:hypothetical protein
MVVMNWSMQRDESGRRRTLKATWTSVVVPVPRESEDFPAVLQAS